MGDGHVRGRTIKLAYNISNPQPYRATTSPNHRSDTHTVLETFFMTFYVSAWRDYMGGVSCASLELTC